jgi:hypothetical protein
MREKDRGLPFITFGVGARSSGVDAGNGNGRGLYVRIHGLIGIVHDPYHRPSCFVWDCSV